MPPSLQRGRRRAHVVDDLRGAVIEARGEGLLPLRERRFQLAAIVGRGAFAGGIGDEPSVGVAQRIPVADLEDDGKAIGERRVERFRAEIFLAA